MNRRQVATGTVLTASLLLGGAGLADAAPGSRPAMDIGAVTPCDRLEHRIDGLDHNIQRLEDRLVRLQERLADARADGEVRRVRHLEAHIARTQRALAKLERVRDQLVDLRADRCEEPQGT